MKTRPQSKPAERKIIAPCSLKQQLILLDDSTDILLCGGGAGGGKALKHGEKVLTPNGFVNIEDIRVGDKITTPKNTTETVENVWPQGVVDIYRIKFQDGRYVDACGEHLWEFHVAGKKSRGVQVENTLALRSRLYKGQRPILQLAVPLTLRSTCEELPIKAYTLGVLLGDGHLECSGKATFTTADPEIRDGVVANGYNVSSGYQKSGQRAKVYYVSGIRDKVRNLGLAGTKSQTKFIPEVYKTTSVANRYALVQGLMDTDGYVSPQGKTYYDTTSEQLCTDIRDVLFSLGYSVTVTTKIGTYKKNGANVECSKVYCLYIRGANQRSLFTLPRKVERCVDKEVGLRVVSVEPCGRSEATCISVTGKDKLFVTTNFVVTHNSHTCLTKALKYINDSAARILIIRRSYPQLKISGGLWDESKKIYRQFGGVPKVQRLTWEFKNGATIQFAAIPDDVSEWQGLQASHILVDESAEFTQEEILFLVSRLRASDYKGHLNVTMTCNPHRDSFLYEWVKYSLDEDTGVPREGTEDIIRYFVNLSGKLHWSSISKDDLWEKYGAPQGYIREHEDTEKINFMPLSFRFIPLTIYDNPILLKNNPQYLANLLGQPRVNQLRYLHGSWTARAEGSGFFRREWVRIVDKAPENVHNRVRSWDLAASIKSESNPDPDYTVGVKMSRDKLGYYTVEDVNRFRKLSDGVIREIISTAMHDGLAECRVTIPKDPGAGGKTANSFQLRTLAEHGVTASSVIVSGHNGKISRFTPFCTLAEAGVVQMVRGDWNDAWLTELEFFEGLRTQKDDQVDATADAFNTLSKSVVLPTFALPDLQQNSPIPEINT